MKMKRLKIKALFLALSLVASYAAVAETAEEKGLAIATEAEKRDTGFKDSIAKMTMELKTQPTKEAMHFLKKEMEQFY